MSLSPVPDLKSNRQLWIVALVVWVVAVLGVLVAHHPDLTRALGDPDDALRLTMVRDLASGQGWFDQRLTRLQPPLGLYMHWSRLVDGGEAGLIKLFALVMPPGQAEMAMRVVWPLLWLAPATTSVLLIARRLGGGRAVFLTAVSVALSIGMSGQFLPGRIDHHNVQIACCLMALAAAVQTPTTATMIVCGLASALGVAVGLEALPYHAAIGLGLALAWGLERDGQRRNVAAYGAAVGLGALALLAAQTPPTRWLTPVCDALAINLVAALAVAGLGLAAAARFAGGLRPRGRLALLGGIGAACGAAYLLCDPVCVHGPMADIDPELRRLWLSHVGEMLPWLQMAKTDPAAGFAFGAPVVCGLVGWIWLGRRERRGRFAWILAGGVMLAGAAMTWTAIRSAEYAVWFSAPLIGAALASVAASSILSRMVPAAFALVAINVLPSWAIAAVIRETGAHDAHAHPVKTKSADGLDACIDARSLAPLARLPAGLVLGEIDEGPYILATSAHATLEAPYHRMTWGIRRSRAILGATPAAAEALSRATGVTYIVDCPAHASQLDRASLPANGLQNALDRGRAPAWLEPLSRAGEPLQIYRVRPARPKSGA